jgi:Glycosyl transferases group 1
LSTVVDRLSEHPEASLLDAFTDASDELGLGARLGEDPEFDAEIIRYLRTPLTYLRHLDRINIIQSLVDAGLPVTICGHGWRDYFGERDHVNFIDRQVDFNDMPGLYENAKIAINLNAGNGACERAIHAALAGAAVVSDFSKNLAEAFKSGDEIAFFNRVRPAGVAEAVGALLESDRGEAVAQAGYARASRSGLWRHRAEKLVEFLR